MIDSFYQVIQEQLHDQFESQKEAMKQASSLMSDAIAQGGVVHAFGSGHSQMFAMELFYRSGGLVPVNALLYPQMSISPMAKLSSVFERLEGWALEALAMETVSESDVMLCASVSGRNGSTVDMALAAKAMGMKVIALTSTAYSNQVSSRHSSGKKLLDIADVVVDLKCPLGDASMELEGVDSRFGATSSILGMAAIEAMACQVVANLANQKVEVPLWVSANLDSEKGKAQNKANQKKYKGRVRFL